MAEIFVSYRRDDSCWSAGRINDHLVSAFGAEKIFFDTINIEPGADFHETIGDSVGRCRVLLAVIGPGWRKTLEERLGRDGDFVCVEIAEALRRGVRVIPLLIDGATPPSEDILPPDLKPLARRHAFPITSERCRSDVDRLIAFLRTYLGDAAGRRCPAARPVHPEMVVVPPGRFVMGADCAVDRPDEAGPRHDVTIERPIAVGRHAVTLAEFSAFVEATGRRIEPSMFTCEEDRWHERRGRSFLTPGVVQSPHHPAVGVSWHDANAYCAWLTEMTGTRYRLLSEAEWEYCCRAGSTTPYSWGARITPSLANYDDVGEGCRTGRERAHQATAPVGAYPGNAWGLCQMHGNVWEWCGDDWHDSYDGAPADGSVWTGGDADLRVLRGGSWMSVPTLLRSATRNKESPDTRMSTIGFRVACTM
ncbi:MAG: SUMF1/EgtB/PvdO family nonheme iron enzyme [Hyphomicrobiaceae bacterium]